MDRKLASDNLAGANRTSLAGEFAGEIEAAQQMRGMVRIRFVGGPLHNKLIVCKPLAKFLFWYIDADYKSLRMPARRETVYHLKHFQTDWLPATPYAQYVHESLLDQHGEPLPQCSIESL